MKTPTSSQLVLNQDSPKCTLHNNHLFAYEVYSRARTIILRTEYAYGEQPSQQTDAIFEGVLDHHFQNPVLPSIILDVEEADTQGTITCNKELIDQGYQTSGWPSFWRDTVVGMVEAISEAGCKTFEISSSYGLNGWVVAKSCEFRSGTRSMD